MAFWQRSSNFCRCIAAAVAACSKMASRSGGALQELLQAVASGKKQYNQWWRRKLQPKATQVQWQQHQCGGSIPAPVAAAYQYAASDGVREWWGFEASATSSRVR